MSICITQDRYGDTRVTLRAGGWILNTVIGSGAVQCRNAGSSNTLRDGKWTYPLKNYCTVPADVERIARKLADTHYIALAPSQASEIARFAANRARFDAHYSRLFPDPGK